MHIHWERKLRLPARSRNPEWPNLHEVARLLGAPCSKVFRKLIKRGILPGRKLPLGADVWVIHRRDLLRFVCNPRNWIYFKTERVQDAQLRRLIELRRAMWGDAWWSPGEADGEYPARLKDTHVWRPSIFMPRWASRITLKITEIRAERLQDISEEDARDEGVNRGSGFNSDGSDGPTTYTDAFAELWESINAKRGFGWDVNPWVWAIGFERV